jgi:two-component system sensor kinase
MIGDMPACDCDPILIKQVFANLLSNAIKYTRRFNSPTILIGSYVAEEETVIYVKDNGAGFDMKYINKLFGLFQRLHGVDEFEGTGVGLSIVQRIIRRHGGRVWGEGEIDKGAIIYFSLPKS